MKQNELDVMRQIKELGGTKKKMENALKAAETRREEFDLRLKEVEVTLNVDRDTLTELGRIVGRYFGYTITPEKLTEELDFIFSDSTIAEYVEGEMKSLPNAEVLAELAKILRERPKENKVGKVIVSEKKDDTESETASNG